MAHSTDQLNYNAFQVVEGGGSKDSITSPVKPGSTKRNFSKKTSEKTPELGDIDFNENCTGMKPHDGNMTVTGNPEGKLKMGKGY